MLYKMRFNGRKNNAIGITYLIVATRKADNIDSARLALYDGYEHVSGIKILSITNDEQGPEAKAKTCQREGCLDEANDNGFCCDACRIAFDVAENGPRY